MPTTTSKAWTTKETEKDKENATNIESKTTQDKFTVISSLISGEGLMAGTGNQISTAKEVENIHKENLDRLATMSKEEILEEQARLKTSLGLFNIFVSSR
jgi:hypothetical protein